MRWLVGILLFALTLQAVDVAAGPGRRGGRSVFAPCNVCHSFTPGRIGWGPSLAGVFGRRAGTSPGFEYSAGMRAAGAAGLVWNETTLDAFLTKPADFIAATAMRFPGLPDPEDRHKVIAYIKFRSTR